MRTALTIGLLLAAPALAHADSWTAVDSFLNKGYIIKVTGMVVGQPTAVTREYPLYSYDSTLASGIVAACHRDALLAMERPGRYTLIVDGVGSDGVGIECTLVRNK